MLKILQLFYVFFKLGLFSFGGGYAMLPLIYQEIQKFGMMDATEFSNLVAISQMTPGPIAVNAATYVGFKAAGVLGSLTATVAVSLPAFVIIILVAHFLQKFKSSKPLQSVLGGIRPATVGMIATAFVFFCDNSLVNSDLARTVFQSGQSVWPQLGSIFSLPAILIAVAAFFSAEKLKVDPVIVILAAGVIGAFVM